MAWADPRPVFDPDAQLDINLDDIFSLKETHHHVVTKDLDYDGLQTALKWVVAKLKAVGGAAAAEPDGRMSKLEEELARLLGENSNLKDRLQTLEKQQEVLQQLSNNREAQPAPPPQSAPPPPPAALTTESPDLSAIYTSLQELEDRVKDLEGHPPWVPQAVGVLGDQPPAPAAAPAGDSPAPAPGVNPMLERRIADLEHSVQDLMGSMQDLADAQGAYSTGALSTGQQQADGGDAAAAAAAAVVPLQQQQQQDRAREAKKEREAIKEEMQGLSGQLEHHGGTLEQHGSELEHLQAQLAALRKRLDDKADRSELDSMLQSGANFATSADEAAGTDANGGAGTEDAAAAAPLVKTADGSPFDPEALIEAVNRSNAEVRAIKNGMGVLQERIKNKADQSGVDELRANLDESAARWKAGMKDVMARRRVEDLEPDIQEVSKRVDIVEREQRRLARDKERKKERKERERAEAKSALPALRLPSEAAAEEGGEAAAAPAPELLQTSDLGAQIKELYSQLGSKANAVDVTSIIMHMRDMADKVKDLQERPLAAGPAEEATQTSRAYSEPASPSWEDGRLERFEAALANLQDSLLCKADVDLVAGKADQDQLDAIGSKLMGMYMDLAAKADRAAVDELKLRVAMLGDKAGGVGAVGPDGLPADLAGINTDGLVQMLQGMMARKAGQEDLDALREMLDSKAGRNEVEALSTRLAAMPLVAAPSSLHSASAALAEKPGGLNSSAFASKDELSTLATQIGDLYAELERQRRELLRVPKDAPLMAMLADQSGLPLSPTQRAAAANRTVGGGGGGAGPDAMKLINALAKEIQDVKDQAEQVAHGVNLLAVGVDHRSPESASPKGAYERLLKLLGSKALRHKMDYFDPDVLNRMAQKVAGLDALLLKNPSLVRVGPDLGLKELEAHVRKMSRELRNLKDRLAETAAAAGVAVPSGDHAMLAGKPLQGYRCLACDRPLEKLDPVPGPFMPTHQLAPKTQPLTTADKPTARQMGPARGGGGNAVLASPEPSSGNLKKGAYDATARGPQQWYENQTGNSADQLPKEDVGPKLAPGGWSRRTSNSGVRVSVNGERQGGTQRPTSGLPDISGPWSPSQKERDRDREAPEGAAAAYKTDPLPHIS